MPFSMSDILAAYGGSPDPENPSSGQITPGLLLRALQAADEQASKAVGQAAGGVRDLAAYPGDVAAGRVPYLPPGLRREDFTDIPPDQTPANNLVGRLTGVAPQAYEPLDPQIQKTVDLGANLMGVGAQFAQPGSAGIFGGRLARNAPLDKYAAADEMVAQGKTRDQIFKATGLTLGKDLQLRHEISDAAMRFTPEAQTAVDAALQAGRALSPMRVGEAIDHPELFQAYPDLAQHFVKFEDPIRGSNSFGGIDKANKTLYLNPRAFDPEFLAQYSITPEQVRRGVVPGLEGMRSTGLHELQHMVQEAEGHAAGGNIYLPEVQKAADRMVQRQAQEYHTELSGIIAQRDAYIREQELAKRDGTPQMFAKEWADQNPLLFNRAAELKYKAYQVNSEYNKGLAKQEAYQNLAGEAESRNTQYRRDMTAAERAATPAWETQDVPFGKQLLRFTDPYGNTIPKAEAAARRSIRQGEIQPGRLQTDLPSFTERMAGARDAAFAGRQRGTGNILPRSTANEAPLLAPGETLGDLQGALTPGMAPAQESIADLGRRSYRERLGLDRPNLQLSAELPAETSGPIIGAGAPYRAPEVRPTVPSPVRIAAPGIYGNPRDIAAQALGQIAPEHPALKELFGVTRRDLADIAASRTGNVDPYTLLPGWKAGSRGSEVGQAVANPVNAQRLIDILAEAQKIPELRDAIGWYVMDPAFQRLAREVGTERAIQIYRPANALTAMASPGSEVPVEIGRGTAASMMAEQGRFPEFVKYGGMKPEERARARKFPPELADVPGHVYHATSQTGPMKDYLRTGEVQMQSPKVPLYIGASGVPETGFQTGLPIADVHYSGGVGSWDLRQAKKWRESMRMPEFQTVGPWYAEQVARPAGLEPVSAQALQWTTLGPHTGVESLLGAPKLELLAQNVWERAMRTGQDPQRLLDLVLQRKAHAAVPR